MSCLTDLSIQRHGLIHSSQLCLLSSTAPCYQAGKQALPDVLVACAKLIGLATIKDAGRPTAVQLLFSATTHPSAVLWRCVHRKQANVVIEVVKLAEALH